MDPDVSADARPYSREALSRGGAREPNAYVFFYGHGPAAGELAVLSNWYVHDTPFEDGGRTYTTSEQHLMWGKAVLFGDQEMADAILQADTPKKAKGLGRKVRNFDENVWQARSVDVMVQALLAKFSQDATCRSVLLATADKILVEAAPRDRIWGIGMGRANPARLDPSTWRGQNKLGEALMLTRARLQAAPRPS